MSTICRDVQLALRSTVHQSHQRECKLAEEPITTRHYLRLPHYGQECKNVRVTSFILRHSRSEIQTQTTLSIQRVNKAGLALLDKECHQRWMTGKE